MASIHTDVRAFESKSDLLLSLLQHIDQLDYGYQKLVAETILLRLFFHLDIAVEGIALKLGRRVAYCDGTRPVLICPVRRSVADVEAHIKRARKVRYLKWTTLADVTDNLAVVFHPNEYFLQHRTTYDADWENMRHIRNHIGHGSKSTGRKFVSVVSHIYGGPKSGVSPGKLLLAKRAAFVGGSNSKSILEQYLLWSKAFIKTLAKA